MSIPAKTSHSARAGAESGRGVALGSLAEQAYLELRDRLIMLDIGPGEPIREADLAAELEIGRTPIREALKLLENDHLVVSYPRRGTFATAVDITDLSAISEMRAALEPMAARRAARTVDAQMRELLAAKADQIAAVTSAMGGAGVAAGVGAGTQSTTAAQRRELLELDLSAHRLVYAAAGNPYLTETLIRLDNLATRIWCLLGAQLQSVPEHISEHLGLLEAIMAGDEEQAAQLASEHVTHFESMVRTALSGT